MLDITGGDEDTVQAVMATLRAMPGAPMVSSASSRSLVSRWSSRRAGSWRLPTMTSRAVSGPRVREFQLMPGVAVAIMSCSSFAVCAPVSCTRDAVRTGPRPARLLDL
ncbi:hypothetical protein [Streptomyces sp. NPDC057686]|uniref:hypothetical protein n=1 Tax=Streptomyces sp. NPDC057686 TaxID=3346212 RepID=UPI0036C6E16F